MPYTDQLPGQEARIAHLEKQLREANKTIAFLTGQGDKFWSYLHDMLDLAIHPATGLALIVIGSDLEKQIEADLASRQPNDRYLNRLRQVIVAQLHKVGAVLPADATDDQIVNEVAMLTNEIILFRGSAAGHWKSLYDELYATLKQVESAWDQAKKEAGIT